MGGFVKMLRVDAIISNRRVAPGLNRVMLAGLMSAFANVACLIQEDS